MATFKCFSSPSKLFFQIMAAILASNLVRVSAKPSFCPVSYSLIGPVCGTDGITYPTMCDLESARLRIEDLELALMRPCYNHCDQHWDPVCGSDMVTYANKCMFENALKANDQLRIFHIGKCMTQPDEYGGPTEYSPMDIKY